MKPIILLMTAALLSSCQTWDGVKAQQSDKYVGKPFDELYSEWGVPTGIAPTRDGGKFMEFRKISGIYVCELKATTDRGGIVRKIQVGGQNGCILP